MDLSNLSCPVKLVLTLEEGLYEYWSLQFEDQLKILWGNMRSFMTESADVSDEMNQWEKRRVCFNSYRKEIKQLWKPITREGFQETYKDAIAGIFSINPTYRELCSDYYIRRFSPKFNGDVPYWFIHSIRESLMDEEQKLLLLEKIDDDFLKDLWDEYGIDALEKVRFPKKPKEDKKATSQN